MSTRGTYRFSGSSDWSPTVAVYNHCDNYPVGGAALLYNTLVHESKGCMGTQFLRANDATEITTDPDDHGDTEYHYEVDGNGPGAMLEVRHRTWPEGCGGDGQWDVIFAGRLHEFLAQEFAVETPDWCAKWHGVFTPFREVEMPYDRKVLMNVVTAKQHLERPYSCLNNLRVWKGKHEGSQNWIVSELEVLRIVNAFPELVTGEICELTGITQLLAELEAPVAVPVADECDVPW